METVIEINQVTKSYGSFTAVHNLSLQVRSGELFAFLGPNGAGKTTTIKMIAGLLTPDSGTLQVCGHSMGHDARSAKAKIAYLPDQPFLYDKLTGQEFLDFVGQMYSMNRETIRSRIRMLADRLEMGEFLNQLTETYSHGMKQRTALAGALLHEPQILVTDEPMVGLDPRTVRRVKDLMREMTRSARTVFMSTHTLEVAEAVADRIGIIHRGRLVAVGTLEQLRTQAESNETLEDIFLRLTADEDDAAAETVPV